MWYVIVLVPRCSRPARLLTPLLLSLARVTAEPFLDLNLYFRRQPLEGIDARLARRRCVPRERAHVKGRAIAHSPAAHLGESHNVPRVVRFALFKRHLWERGGGAGGVVGAREMGAREVESERERGRWWRETLLWAGGQGG